MTAWVELQKSGRWKGCAKYRGQKKAQTFDYEYEAQLFADAADAAMKAAYAAGGPTAPARPAQAAQPAPAPLAVASAPVVSTAVSSTYTVGSWASRFYDIRKGKWADATRSWYGTYLGYIERDDDLAAIPLGELTRTNVDEWMSRQVEDGDGRSAINARRKALAVALNYAASDRLVDRVVTDLVEELDTTERPERFLDPEEIERLLAQVDATKGQPGLRAQVLLALDAGLRWEEVFGLPASAITTRTDKQGRERMYVQIWQVTERKTRALRPYPKGKRKRTVPVTTARLREALIAARAAAWERTGGEADALLFIRPGTKAEEPLRYEWFRKSVWITATHAAGLNRRVSAGGRLRFHDLRHTYGTILSDQGVPRKEIAELMGHADEKTTARYIHSGSDGRRWDLVEAALGYGDDTPDEVQALALAG